MTPDPSTGSVADFTNTCVDPMTGHRLGDGARGEPGPQPSSSSTWTSTNDGRPAPPEDATVQR